MKEKSMTYIAIVDDKKSLRNVLKDRLHSFENLSVIFMAENGVDFLEKMVEAKKSILPDIVLMDIDMPVMDGIAAVMHGKERYPESKYLMLTIFDEDDKLFNALKAGADGYLLKDEPVEKIREAIFHLLNNEGVPMSPSIARRTLNLLIQSPGISVSPESKKQENDFNLTEREKEVLTYLVDGYEYKEIAGKMLVSPNTIRNHLSNIYKKLHVSSKTQAIRVFVKNYGEA